MRSALALALVLLGGACGPLAATAYVVRKPDDPARGPASMELETRSAADRAGVDGAGARWTAEVVARDWASEWISARRYKRHGMYVRFDTALGYARDGGVYLNDGYQIGWGWIGERSFVAASAGGAWGGHQGITVGGVAGIHALFLDTLALDAEGGSRIPRELDDGTMSEASMWSLGARLHVGGKVKASLSARVLREDGHTYALFGVGVERFFEAYDPAGR